MTVIIFIKFIDFINNSINLTNKIGNNDRHSCVSSLSNFITNKANAPFEICTRLYN